MKRMVLLIGVVMLLLGCGNGGDGSGATPASPYYCWTKRAGSTGGDYGNAVCTDANGNVYITGMFSNTVDFAEDWGGSDSKTSAGGYDIFITKINADGSYGWTRRIGGTADDYGNGICTDTDGNVYVTGSFQDTVNFAEDWGSNDSKTAVDTASDIFIMKINANGTYGWTKRIGDTDSDVGHSICTDTDGNVYATGLFGGTVNFAADWSSNDSKTFAGWDDIFVTRINADGSYGWTKRIGGANTDIGQAIYTDTNGNIYVTGRFEGTVDFAEDWTSSDSKTSAGSADIFITKINADGSYGWTKRLGGINGDVGLAVCTDTGGNVYAAGVFRSTVDFAEDWTSSDSKTSAGNADIFITKINADGSYGWTRRMGGTGDDLAYGICTGTSGRIYVTGCFEDIVDFAEDWASSDSKTSAGSADIFITTVNADSTYGWTKHIGGTNSDWGYGISTDTNGNVYVTGRFWDTVNFAEDWGDSDSKTSAGGHDIFITKIR